VQIYTLDTAKQLNVRRTNNNNLDPIVMDNLQTMLLDSHPYIGQYHHAYELIKEKPVDEQQEVTIRLQLIICLLLKKLQLSFLRMGYIMH